MHNVVDIAYRFKRHEERRVLTACTHVAGQLVGSPMATLAGDEIYTPAELDRACDIEAKRAYFVAYAAMDQYWREVMSKVDSRDVGLLATLKQQYEDTVGLELFTRGT